MPNMIRRALTGVVIVAVITAAVFYHIYSFFLLCLTINVLGVWEFYTLFPYTNEPVRKTLGLLVSVFLLLTTCLWLTQQLEIETFFALIPLTAAIFISELYRKSPTPFVNLGLMFLGIIYITLPCLLLFACGFTYSSVNYQSIVLGYFFLVWANDTGAYITGSIFGKTPLFLRISPHKTWEGSAGGAVMVMVVAYANHILWKELMFADWVIMGGIVIVFGTFGDLVKSLMKRSVNKKDSGHILPGHGGILDRFDSVLGSVPWLYAYLMLSKME